MTNLMDKVLARLNATAIALSDSEQEQLAEALAEVDKAVARINDRISLGVSAEEAEETFALVDAEEAVRALIETRTPIRFTYTDADGVESVREASPHELLYSLDGDPYLVAYDHHREAPRNFRLDRLGALAEAPELGYLGELA